MAQSPSKAKGLLPRHWERWQQRHPRRRDPEATLGLSWDPRRPTSGVASEEAEDEEEGHEHGEPDNNEDGDRLPLRPPLRHGVRGRGDSAGGGAVRFHLGHLPIPSSLFLIKKKKMEGSKSWEWQSSFQSYFHFPNAACSWSFQRIFLARSQILRSQELRLERNKLAD